MSSVNYVAYIDPLAHGGGGELIMREVLAVARARGTDVRVSSLYPTRRLDAAHDARFTVAADLHNIPQRWWSRWPDGWLEETLGCRPYVHVDNAYVDVCDLGYLPCNGEREAPACPFKQRRWLRDTRCFTSRTAELYRAAALNVFLSPLHRSIVQRLVGERTVGRSFVMRPIIDTGRFRNEHGPRDIEYLYLGHFNEAKGADEIMARFPGGNIVIAGRVEHRKYRHFGRQLGPVGYDDVPALLNRAKVFVHLPHWPEPQGRGVVEAALCGCRLLLNDHVGAASFDFDLADPRSYEGAAEEAWEAISGAVC